MATSEQYCPLQDGIPFVTSARDAYNLASWLKETIVMLSLQLTLKFRFKFSKQNSI